MRPRSLLHPFAVMKMACRDALCDARMVFRDATETGLTPSAFLVASCKMSKSNPAQHAATKIQTNIATTVGGKLLPMNRCFRNLITRASSFSRGADRPLNEKSSRPWNRAGSYGEALTIEPSRLPVPPAACPRSRGPSLTRPSWPKLPPCRPDSNCVPILPVHIKQNFPAIVSRWADKAAGMSYSLYLLHMPLLHLLGAMALFDHRSLAFSVIALPAIYIGSYLLSICTEAQRGKVKQRLRAMLQPSPGNRSSQAY